MGVLVVVFFMAVLVLFLGEYGRGKWANRIGLIGLFVAFCVSFYPENIFWENYQKMFLYSEDTAILVRITLWVSLMIFGLGDDALYRHRCHQSEVYALTLFSLCGGIVLLGFENLTTLFLGIEILSIPLYVLAGSDKRNLYSIEASVKYFLMGAFATGFLLFGFALIYGSSGSLDLMNIRAYASQTMEPMFLLGMVLVFVAMAFKIAMVPFHLWSPDVYYGSPSWVTLFMASVVKMVGFYAFFKLMNYVFEGYRPAWISILWILVSITLLLGSVLGLVQKNVKKMMAYSSIVNAGYISLVFFGVNQYSMEYLSFYLFGYSLANIGVFMGIIWIEKNTGEHSLEAFSALGKKQPLLAFTMAISVFSMAGIPFTMGFMGKLNLFLQTIQETVSLVIIAVLASVISIAYYLKIIMTMYFTTGNFRVGEKLSFSYKLVSIIVIVFILFLGMFPNWFYSFFQGKYFLI